MTKKLLLALGTVAAVAAPMSAVVACSVNNSDAKSNEGTGIDETEGTEGTVVNANEATGVTVQNVKQETPAALVEGALIQRAPVLSTKEKQIALSPAIELHAVPTLLGSVTFARKDKLSFAPTKKLDANKGISEELMNTEIAEVAKLEAAKAAVEHTSLAEWFHDILMSAGITSQDLAEGNINQDLISQAQKAALELTMDGKNFRLSADKYNMEHKYASLIKELKDDATNAHTIEKLTIASIPAMALSDKEKDELEQKAIDEQNAALAKFNQAMKLNSEKLNRTRFFHEILMLAGATQEDLKDATINSGLLAQITKAANVLAATGVDYKEVTATELKTKYATLIAGVKNDLGNANEIVAFEEKEEDKATLLKAFGEYSVESTIEAKSGSLNELQADAEKMLYDKLGTDKNEFAILSSSDPNGMGKEFFDLSEQLKKNPNADVVAGISELKAVIDAARQTAGEAATQQSDDIYNL